MDPYPANAYDAVFFQLIQSWFDASQIVKRTEAEFNNLQNELIQAYSVISAMWIQLCWLSNQAILQNNPFAMILANNAQNQPLMPQPAHLNQPQPVRQVRLLHPTNQVPPHQIPANPRQNILLNHQVPVQLQPNNFLMISQAVTPMALHVNAIPTRQSRKRVARAMLKSSVVKIERFDAPH